MNNKNLINKLSNLASILSHDEFLNCDIVIASDRVRLTNWKHGIITIVALRHIAKVCAFFGFLYFIDFDGKKVVIYE